MRLFLTYDNNWDSIRNINYDALNDLLDNFPQLLSDTDFEQLEGEALDEFFRWMKPILLMPKKDRTRLPKS